MGGKLEVVLDNLVVCPRCYRINTVDSFRSSGRSWWMLHCHYCGYKEFFSHIDTVYSLYGIGVVKFCDLEIFIPYGFMLEVEEIDEPWRFIVIEG